MRSLATFASRSGTALLCVLLVITAGSTVYAHDVALRDKDLIRGGEQIAVFLYLGAKHMVTGYDHLLFLFGVIFFLYHLRDVAVYVTLFALGHSITLLSAVLGRVTADAYLVDAIIGLSVVYKALDNMGAFKTLFGLWRDEASMRAYRNSGAHLKAMPKLLNWCDEASFAHWSDHTDAIPSADGVRAGAIAWARVEGEAPSPRHRSGGAAGGTRRSPA